MNNTTAAMIRNYGMELVADGLDFSEMIQTDSGKFVFPVTVNDITYFCEIDFIAKKEDYTPDYDIRKYAEKLEKAKIRAQELEAKKQAKAKKENKV